MKTATMDCVEKSKATPARSKKCRAEWLAREAALLARVVMDSPVADRTIDDNGDCKLSRVYDRLSDNCTEARDVIATSEVGAAYQAILLHQYGGLLGSCADPDGIRETLRRNQRILISEHDATNARTALSILTVMLRRLDDADLYTLYLFDSEIVPSKRSLPAMRAEFERYTKRLAAHPVHRMVAA